jgi:ATP-dependent Clp protease ATP-binding subunit ClpC
VSEPDRFSKFTEHARRVLHLAEKEELRLNHNYIGTEHILLALLQVPDGVGANVLQSLDVEPDLVRREVEGAIGRGDSGGPDQVGLTPGGKTVILEAVSEARGLGHHYVGTEHLLLGLIGEGKGIAARVLAGQGVGLERARLRTIHMLNDMRGTSEIVRGSRAIDRGDRRGWGRWLSRLGPWR